MKLSERLVWALVVCLGGYYIDTQQDKIEKLEQAVAYNTDFELKNLQRQVFYSMLLDSIDMQTESNEQYNELLDLFADNEN